jgi:peptide/nickel transport system substrate-binding protein
MRRNLWLVLTLTVALLFTGATLVGQAWGQPKQGGTLSLGIGKDLSTMNPLVRTMSTDQSIRELIYESLLTLDAKGEIQPLLAESYETSKDGKTYTFHLRKGVKFHNGREMSAEDVKYAIDYTLDPKNGAYGRSRLELVKGVEAPDPFTLKIQLKGRSAAFLSALSDIKAFSVIPKGSISSIKPRAYPAGTGPFRFTEWQTKQHIVFEKNADYWGQKPYLDKVILRPIRNGTVRFTALRAGDVDIIERTPYEWARQVLSGKFKEFGTAEAATSGYRAMFFNVVDGPFSNKKMRLAVAYGMDKKKILEAAFFGFGETADQKYPKGHFWYMNGIPAPSFDPAKAKKYLEESGYKGEKIIMKIEQNDSVEAMSAAFQAQMKQIGMNIELAVFEYGARRAQIRAWDTTLDMVGGGYYTDPISTYRSQFTCQDPKKRASNWSGFCSQEVQDLFEKLDFELNTDQRKKILTRVITILSDEIPVIPIGFVPRYFAHRQYVKGFSTDSSGGRFVWGGGGLMKTWLDK